MRPASRIQVHSFDDAIVLDSNKTFNHFAFRYAVAARQSCELQIDACIDPNVQSAFAVTITSAKFVPGIALAFVLLSLPLFPLLVVVTQ